MIGVGNLRVVSPNRREPLPGELAPGRVEVFSNQLVPGQVELFIIELAPGRVPVICDLPTAAANLPPTSPTRMQTTAREWISPKPPDKEPVAALWASPSRKPQSR